MLFMVQFIIRSHLFRFDPKMHMEMSSTHPQQSNCELELTFAIPRGMRDGYQSLEYITCQSFTDRAQKCIIERKRGAYAKYVFLFSSLNWNRFCCRDVVYLILHVRLRPSAVVGHWCVPHARCTWRNAHADRAQHTNNNLHEEHFGTERVRPVEHRIKRETGFFSRIL